MYACEYVCLRISCMHVRESVSIYAGVFLLGGKDGGEGRKNFLLIDIMY